MTNTKRTLKKIANCFSIFLILFFIGCEFGSDPSQSDTGSINFIITSTVAIDYTEGNVGLVDIDSTVSYENLLAIGSDNFVKAYNGCSYICDRTKNTVIKITGSTISSEKVDYETPIGNNANIHDIAFVSETKAYITQYNLNQLAVFNPSTGELISPSIDLSGYVAFYGTDSVASAPYMDNAVYVNGKIYVTCQRLYTGPGGYLTPGDTSLVLVISADNNTVLKVVKLQYKNPQGISVSGDKLYVSCTGSYGLQDGGIECIDLTTDTNTGPVVAESGIGGDITTPLVVSESKGYVIYSTGWPASAVKEFNPTTNVIGADVAGVEVAAGLSYDGTYFYIGDRSSTAPGIVKINPTGNVKVGDTYDVGLPPNTLAYLKIEN